MYLNTLVFGFVFVFGVLIYLLIFVNVNQFVVLFGSIHQLQMPILEHRCFESEYL